VVPRIEAVYEELVGGRGEDGAGRVGGVAGVSGVGGISGVEGVSGVGGAANGSGGDGSVRTPVHATSRARFTGTATEGRP
jgi:hypothetical protein